MYLPKSWIVSRSRAAAQDLRSIRTSVAHGRCIMRNHDLVSDAFLTLIAASLVLLGSSLLAFAIV
jgi:hypothetical protein